MLVGGVRSPALLAIGVLIRDSTRAPTTPTSVCGGMDSAAARCVRQTNKLNTVTEIARDRHRK
jgi:hypothetical protein